MEELPFFHTDEGPIPPGALIPFSLLNRIENGGVWAIINGAMIPLLVSVQPTFWSRASEFSASLDFTQTSGVPPSAPSTNVVSALLSMRRRRHESAEFCAVRCIVTA